MAIEYVADRLDNMGFCVDISKETPYESYNVYIQKNGLGVSLYFKYPVCVDQKAVRDAENMFIASIVDQFNKKKKYYDAHVNHDIHMAPIKPLVPFEIKDVIFNPPATIVFWKDGAKTVVKAETRDVYDPEKGLAMAIAKKALGNKYSYYNTFLKWLKKYKLNFN